MNNEITTVTNLFCYCGGGGGGIDDASRQQHFLRIIKPFETIGTWTVTSVIYNILFVIDKRIQMNNYE